MQDRPTQPNQALYDQYAHNIAPGPDYQPDGSGFAAELPKAVRLIAFYLPQFHAIAENDAWWGTGFTEWTNVTKALPRFVGHYQPRLPADLGFYDPTQADTLRKQAAMARKYGLEGFCFHHYWFAGERLLERPVEVLLAHPEIDLPFCVNWANENWTRRWDGNESEVLRAQHHSPADDIAFARTLEPLFADPRYIRIDGRPFLMLYRPGLLPDAAATVARWREHFRSAGIGEIYVTMARAFGEQDPHKYGMDAVVGFPPHWTGWELPRVDPIERLDARFAGSVVAYDVAAAAAVRSNEGHPTLLPGVCPAWDNEARKPLRGFCLSGANPRAYGRWLEHAARFVMRERAAGERIVFINAWNEWAEGAYLEPDRHFGHAYLVETAAVLRRLLGEHAEPPVLTDTTAPPNRASAAVSRPVRRAAGRLGDLVSAALMKLALRLRQ